MRARKVIEGGVDLVHLQQGDTMEEYRVLETLDFTSKRKRMSVVVRSASTGALLLICKGADNVVRDRLFERDTPLVQASQAHADEYSNQGLRTLFVAWAALHEDNFEAWQGVYKAAIQAGDAAQVEALQEQLEVGLELLGVTAIEDKLQRDVGNTLVSLKRAQIKVCWGGNKQTLPRAMPSPPPQHHSAGLALGNVHCI